MRQLVDEIIEHVSFTQRKLAGLLETERHIAVRMAQVVHALPEPVPAFGGAEAVVEQAGLVNKSVVAYLNSLAALQEQMAEQVAMVMKELEGDDEE